MLSKIQTFTNTKHSSGTVLMITSVITLSQSVLILSWLY